MFKSIRKSLTEIKKDIAYALDIEKKDLDDIPSMRRDKEIKIAPKAFIAPDGPRIKYKHR